MNVSAGSASVPAGVVDACMSQIGSCVSRTGTVVDLFCGVGALSHAFVLEGFDVRGGIDVDSSCRYAYEHNNRAQFIEKGVEDLTARAVGGLFADDQPKILVGCAPCQPFSTYSRNTADTKWRLLKEFGRLIRDIRPDIVSMENVARLVTFRNGSVFDEFLDILEACDYTVWEDVVDCSAYGVPQTRRRLVVLASRIGPIELVPPTRKPNNPVTVRETISDLPPVTAGGQDSDDPLHRASRLSTTNLARIRVAKPGQSWKDWDPALVAECHRRHSGRWYGGVYGRMSWDAPAPTITTQCNGFGNGRFGHPEQDRAMSLREAALLQTFPRSYEFYPPGEKVMIAAAARWIGNAVPVSLGRAVARSVGQTLAEAGHA